MLRTLQGFDNRILHGGTERRFHEALGFLDFLGFFCSSEALRKELMSQRKFQSELGISVIFWALIVLEQLV